MNSVSVNLMRWMPFIEVSLLFNSSAEGTPYISQRRKSLVYNTNKNQIRKCNHNKTIAFSYFKKV